MTIKEERNELQELYEKMIEAHTDWFMKLMDSVLANIGDELYDTEPVRAVLKEMYGTILQHGFKHGWDAGYSRACIEMTWRIR